MAQRSERRSLSTKQFLPRSPTYSESVLTEPGLTRLSHFYQLLHTSLGASPVQLQVPETLVVSEEGRDVLLYTGPSGAVETWEGVDLWSRYLDLCSGCLRRSGETEEFPLFIFLVSGLPPKVLFSVAEARKMWNQSKDHTKRLQRFIIPYNNEVTKLRIVWSLDETKRFAIKRRTPEPVLREAKRPTVKATSSFNYASKLQRSSFSPYMPYKSTLTAAHSAESLTLRQSETYYVSSRMEGECVTEQVYVAVPGAEAMIATIKAVICPQILRDEERVLELGYDTVQEADGRVYLLDVKWVKTGKLEVKRVAAVEESKHKDVRQHFSRLLSSEPSAKTPFIDMHEIQEQNVKMYLQRLATMPAGCPAQPPPNSINLRAEIEEAGSKLDSLLQAACVNRMKADEDQKVKLESYPKENFLDYIIAKVYAKVTSDPDLADYFHNMDQREINMIKFGFSKAFTGVDNYYFKRTVKKVHEGLGITAAHFDRFIELFMCCLREEGVRSEDVEIVHRHLTRFVDEVVEDDTPERTSKD